MNKKGIRKLAKLKILFYSFCILPFIVIACSIITHFVGNIAKYWLNFITSNYFSILIFIALVPTGLLLLSTNAKGKIIGIIIILIALPFCWLIFSNIALPLDQDLYTMITKSYSEVNGPLVATKIKHNKNGTNAELIVHDNKQNINISITFEDESSPVFVPGDNVNVKYLPHSHMGISHSKGSEDFINKNPFSPFQPSTKSKNTQITNPGSN